MVTSRELRTGYLAALPLIAVMLIPDDEEGYDPRDVAHEALDLIEACVNAAEEYQRDVEAEDRRKRHGAG